MSCNENDLAALLQRLTRAELLIEAHESYDKLAHEALVQRLTQMQEATQIAFEVNETAVRKAEVALEKRLDSVNEFRKQLSDQAVSFATKEYVESRFDANGRRIGVVENFQSKILGAIALALVVIPLFSALAYYAVGSTNHQHANVVTVTTPTPTP